MKLLLSLSLSFSFICLSAQRPAADQLQTAKGPVSIQPVFHGALALTWNNKTIFVDPYGGSKAFSGLGTPDLILITDIHPDHLDTATLNSIETSKATFIVPQAVADLMPAKYKKKLVIVANGKNTMWEGIRITAVPMYNLPEEPGAKHTRGRGNGYLLNISDKTIYISGDTEDIAEMRSLKKIDVAFVCMNLPYTMDVEQAASAVLEFKPAVVYPFHYRGKEGMSDTQKFKDLVNAKDTKTEVRLRNWYTEY